MLFPVSKPRTVHRCAACGETTPQWLGRCPGCDEWGSLVEQRPPSPSAGAGGPARPGARPIPLAEVDLAAEPVRSTGIGELDRVLGGGLVPGSVTLVGGEPGIGKSSLLLQALAALAPGVLVAASTQRVFAPDAGAAPGPVGQVREGAARLVREAKERTLTTV